MSGGASSIRHGLGFDIERKLVDEFSLRSGFDWSRSISDRVFFHVSNSRDLASERAVSGRRPLRRGYLNSIFDLPVNFKAGLFGSLMSGVASFRDHPVSGMGSFSPYPCPATSITMEWQGIARCGSETATLLWISGPVDRWFDTSAFAEPEELQFGDSGRNIVEGPGLQTWDVALSKSTEVSDGHQVEFRLEFFNALNRANFNRLSTSLGDSTFGQVFGADRAREIEVALKYSF